VNAPIQLDKKQARRLILARNHLSFATKPTSDPKTVQTLIENLGYVQIDTIFVVERSHHHILYSRLPSYQRQDLAACQSNTKTIFESWTHALSYVPTRDLPYYIGPMKAWAKKPSSWFHDVDEGEYKKIKNRIAKLGPLTIRDMDDKIEGKKNDWWDSNKPSKKLLQFGFHAGDLVISKRIGILKEYDLLTRHFHNRSLKAASETDRYEFLVTRALGSQGIVNLDSICHLRPSQKPEVRSTLEQMSKTFFEARVKGLDVNSFWVSKSFEHDLKFKPDDSVAHILSPFDPIVIQRKRLQMFFDFNYVFEAYVPEKKRKFGYFLLPVLIGDQFVAGLDLKTDRQNKKLVIKNFHWFTKKSKSQMKLIEERLHHFEQFQLALQN